MPASQAIISTDASPPQSQIMDKTLNSLVVMRISIF